MRTSAWRVPGSEWSRRTLQHDVGGQRDGRDFPPGVRATSIRTGTGPHRAVRTSTGPPPRRRPDFVRKIAAIRLDSRTPAANSYPWSTGGPLSAHSRPGRSREEDGGPGVRQPCMPPPPTDGFLEFEIGETY